MSEERTSILNSIETFPIYEKVFSTISSAKKNENENENENDDDDDDDDDDEEKYSLTTSMQLDYLLRHNHPSISVEYGRKNANIEELVRNIYQTLQLRIVEGQISAVTKYVQHPSLTMRRETVIENNDVSLSVFGENSYQLNHKQSETFHYSNESDDNPLSEIYRTNRISFLDSPVGCGKTYQTAIASILRIVYYETLYKMRPVVAEESNNLDPDQINTNEHFNIIVCCVNTSLVGQYAQTFSNVISAMKLYYPEYEIDILVNPKETVSGHVDLHKYVILNNKVLIIISSLVTKFDTASKFMKYIKSMHFDDTRNWTMRNHAINCFIRDENTKNIARDIELHVKNVLLTCATIFTEDFGMGEAFYYENSMFGEKTERISKVLLTRRCIESRIYAKDKYKAIRKWLHGRESTSTISNFHTYALCPPEMVFYWLICSLLCPKSSQNLITDVLGINEDVNVVYFDIVSKCECRILNGTRFSTDISLRFKSGIDILVDYICDTVGRKKPFIDYFSKLHPHRFEINVPILKTCIEKTKNDLFQELQVRQCEESLKSFSLGNNRAKYTKNEHEKEIHQFENKYNKLFNRICGVVNEPSSSSSSSSSSSNIVFTCAICLESNENEKSTLVPCITSCCLKREICTSCIAMIMQKSNPSCPFCRTKNMTSGDLEVSYDVTTATTITTTTTTNHEEQQAGEANGKIDADLLTNDEEYAPLREFLRKKLEQLQFNSSDARTIFETILSGHVDFHQFHQFNAPFRVVLILNDERFVKQLSENDQLFNKNGKMSMKCLQSKSSNSEREQTMQWFQREEQEQEDEQDEEEEKNSYKKKKKKKKNNNNNNNNNKKKSGMKDKQEEPRHNKIAIKILTCVRSGGIRDTMTGLNFDFPPHSIINLTDDRNQEHDIVQSLGRLSRMDISTKLKMNSNSSNLSYDSADFLFFNVKTT